MAAESRPTPVTEGSNSPDTGHEVRFHTVCMIGAQTCDEAVGGLVTRSLWIPRREQATHERRPFF